MKRIVLAVAALAAMGSMFIAPAFAQVAPEKGKVAIALGSAVSVDSVIDTLKGGSFDEVSVQGSFTVSGQSIQDFMTITPNQGSSDVSSKWSDARKVLIAELEKNGFFTKNSKFATAPASTDDSATFMVKNITVFGEKQAVLNVAGKFTGAHSGFQGGNGNGSNVGKSPNKAQPVSPIGSGQVTALAVANSPYYLLLPISGSVVTGLFTAPGVTGTWRGVQNFMGWNSNGFASDQTYEHDFFLDAAGGTYFARSFSLPPYCQPNAVYAATSWPSASFPYLDSDLERNGFCSSAGDIAYSIGAAQANAITPGMTHFTALLMPSGDASTDTFKLQGQIGYQNPVGSHSTLTSFPYGYVYSLIKPPYTTETTHYYFIKNGGIVPGSRAWTNVGYVPDTPILSPVTNPTQSSLQVNFVDVTWDETNIVVERSVGTGGPWSVFNFGILNAGNSVGSWYWTNSGLARTTNYCYRMKATNAKGGSAYSPTACGMTL